MYTEPSCRYSHFKHPIKYSVEHSIGYLEWLYFELKNSCIHSPALERSSLSKYPIEYSTAVWKCLSHFKYPMEYPVEHSIGYLEWLYLEFKNSRIHSLALDRVTRDAYRVAKTRRISSLYTSFSAKEPYNKWLFREKWPATGRPASGGALAPEQPRATGVGTETLQMIYPRNNDFSGFFRDRTSPPDVQFPIGLVLASCLDVPSEIGRLPTWDVRFQIGHWSPDIKVQFENEEVSDFEKKVEKLRGKRARYNL